MHSHPRYVVSRPFVASLFAASILRRGTARSSSSRHLMIVARERISNMHPRRLALTVLIAGLGILPLGSAAVQAQEGQPLDLPCVSGVSMQPLGQAMPDSAAGQVMALLRLTIAPGGGFEAHTHPGTLVVSVESGSLTLTQFGDTGMSVMRAGFDATPASSVPMSPGEPVMLESRDWFVEPEGMVHTAFSHGVDPTVVLLTGLVDPNQPFVQCVVGTPTP